MGQHGMNFGRKYFSFALAIALALPHASHAGRLASVTLSDFMPADQTTVERFRCVGSRMQEPDVVVEYGLVSKDPARHESRLRSLSVRGVGLPARMLREINGLIGDDALAGVSAGCAGGDVRVVLQVFRPDSIAPDACLADANQYIHLYYRARTKTLGFE